jgi:hypothetical protein
MLEIVVVLFVLSIAGQSRASSGTGATMVGVDDWVSCDSVVDGVEEIGVDDVEGVNVDIADEEDVRDGVEDADEELPDDEDVVDVLTWDEDGVVIEWNVCTDVEVKTIVVSTTDPLGRVTELVREAMVVWVEIAMAVLEFPLLD